MSDLKNIFIGDKVVQQAYLNDSIFYQADTWVNTPSTYQNIYKKNPINSSYGGTAMAINSRREIYVSDYVINSSNSGYIDLRLTKLSSEGNVIDHKIIDTYVYVDTEATGSWNSKICAKTILWINSDDTVHLFYQKQPEANSWQIPYLANITDSAGKGFTVKTIRLGNFVDHVYSVAHDDKCVYVPVRDHSTNAMPTKFYYFDYNGSQVGTSPVISSSSDNGWSQVYITYCVKNDTYNSIACSVFNMRACEFHLDTLQVSDLPISPSTKIGRLAVDNMGNLYSYNFNAYYSTDAYHVDKYSYVNKKGSRYTLPRSGWDSDLGKPTYGTIETYSLAFDSMYNLYVIAYTADSEPQQTESWGCRIYKFNVSGTIDWHKRFSYNANEAPNYTIAVDNLDNIYAIDSQGTLTLEQNINLQQTS